MTTERFQLLKLLKKLPKSARRLLTKFKRYSRSTLRKYIRPTSLSSERGGEVFFVEHKALRGGDQLVADFMVVTMWLLTPVQTRRPFGGGTSFPDKKKVCRRKVRLVWITLVYY
eukprot:jgi/Botrbrau1/15221/Bobra.0149s0076.1